LFWFNALFYYAPNKRPLEKDEREGLNQGRIQLITLVKSNEVYFTTLVRQNNGRQNGLKSRTLRQFEHVQRLTRIGFDRLISELQKYHGE